MTGVIGFPMMIADCRFVCEYLRMKKPCATEIRCTRFFHAQTSCGSARVLQAGSDTRNGAQDEVDEPGLLALAQLFLIHTAT